MSEIYRDTQQYGTYEYKCSSWCVRPGKWAELRLVPGLTQNSWGMGKRRLCAGGAGWESRGLEAKGLLCARTRVMALLLYSLERALLLLLLVLWTNVLYVLYSTVQSTYVGSSRSALGARQQYVPRRIMMIHEDRGSTGQWGPRSGPPLAACRLSPHSRIHFRIRADRHNDHRGPCIRVLYTTVHVGWSRQLSLFSIYY